MKTFLAFLLAICALTASSFAQTATLSFPVLNGQPKPFELVVPNGATQATVTVVVRHYEFCALENMGAQRQRVIQHADSYVSAQVAWNVNDFTTPTPFAPFINDGYWIQRDLQCDLDAFDDVLDYSGPSGSADDVIPSAVTTAADSATFPLTLLQGPRLFVQVTETLDFSPLPEHITQAYNAAANVLVRVTYR